MHEATVRKLTEQGENQGVGPESHNGVLTLRQCRHHHAWKITANLTSRLQLATTRKAG